jgi:hypothetical protein
VRTLNDETDKVKYPCHGSKECTASWTYDDWHCSGCHWKGMGVQDLLCGDDKLRKRAEDLREKLRSK